MERDNLVPDACRPRDAGDRPAHLAGLSGLSLPTIQRMEASDGVVRGNVDSLMKLVGALQEAGIELIAEGATSSQGGRGVRLTTPTPAARGPARMIAARAVRCIVLLLGLAVAGGSLARRQSGRHDRLRRQPGHLIGLAADRAALARRRAIARHPCRSACPGSARISASIRSPRSSCSWSDLGSAGASLYALGYGRHEARTAARPAVLSGLPRRPEPRGASPTTRSASCSPGS